VATATRSTTNTVIRAAITRAMGVDLTTTMTTGTVAGIDTARGTITPTGMGIPTTTGTAIATAPSRA
jgi:hypothetical protein